ncbi:BV-EC31 [Parapoynx stagnalis nucleopolyhedrovirus]|uniref:BV-EC31 n=1 Tax=Parapoynx stagnalis nucleopolyhedrovirus TaxID=2993413 RepID=A0A9E8C0K1_9ABAC|nr:BV-EC31 [Parapoynx stagnalis nucleopolyhedrovirus]
MNLTIKLTPISLDGTEENENRAQSVSIMPSFIDDDEEICFNVKCHSPFSKFKLTMVIEDFEEAYLQATFCNNSNNITIVNTFQQKKLIFDGFIIDDEGVTKPFIIGPLFSINQNVVVDSNICNVVKKIEEKQTLLKVFINEANVFSKWNKFKGLFFNNLINENLLINNVAKFCSDSDDVECSSSSSGSNKINNVTKWVPVLNYFTGKKLLNILFIFKFN